MHVLVVASWYKTAAAPISGSFFEDQARCLVERGHRVSVLWPEWTGSFRGALRAGFRDEDAEYEDGGLPTYHLRVHPRLPRDNRVNSGHLTRRIRRFAAAYAARHGRPNLVHAHSALWAGHAGMALRDLWQVPFVLTEHNSGLVVRRHELSTFVKRHVTAIAGSADRLLCVSHKFKDDLVTSYGAAFEPAHVLGNVIDESFFRPAAPRPASGSFRWINVGALVPVKRQALLLDAFRMYADLAPDARLDIVGNGPLRERLGEQVRALGLESRVAFHGTLPREELIALLSLANAFVSSSAYETFGVAIAEALAMGLPVAATDSGGPRDFLTAASGVFAVSDGPADVAAAMRRVAEGAFDAASMSRTLHARYGRRAIALRLEETYASVIR